MHLLYGLEAPTLLLFTAEGLKKTISRYDLVTARKTPNVHHFVSSYVLLSRRAKSAGNSGSTFIRKRSTKLSDGGVTVHVTNMFEACCASSASSFSCHHSCLISSLNTLHDMFCFSCLTMYYHWR